MSIHQLVIQLVGHLANYCDIGDDDDSDDNNDDENNSDDNDNDQYSFVTCKLSPRVNFIILFGLHNNKHYYNNSLHSKNCYWIPHKNLDKRKQLLFLMLRY